MGGSIQEVCLLVIQDLLRKDMTKGGFSSLCQNFPIFSFYDLEDLEILI